MGFDPIKASIAAGKVLDLGEKVSEQVGKHLDGHARRKQESMDGEVRRQQEILDGYAKRSESYKNSETDRAIRINKQKADNFGQYVNTIFNALETCSNIYKNINGTINVSHEINAQIEKDRNQFELDKKTLDKELEDIRNNHKNKSQEIYNSHEAKMRELEFQHKKEMTVIENVQNSINRQFDLLECIAKENPSNPQIIVRIAELNNAILQLSNFDNTKYLEDE